MKRREEYYGPNWDSRNVHTEVLECSVARLHPKCGSRELGN